MWREKNSQVFLKNCRDKCYVTISRQNSTRTNHNVQNDAEKGVKKIANVFILACPSYTVVLHYLKRIQHCESVIVI